MNATPELDNLVLQWADAKTERERARMESLIWEIIPKAERSGGTQRKWVVSLLKTIDPRVGTTDVEGRQCLWNSGEISDPIWSLIDGQERMTINSGVMVLRSARKSAAINGTWLGEELAKSIKAYLSLPLHKLHDGRSFRKAVRSVSDKRDDWSALRLAIARIIDHELMSAADGNVRSRLRGQMEVEISSMIKILSARVRRTKDSAYLDNGVGQRSEKKRRHELREACQLLSVDAPAPGKLVDLATYQKAKKNYRTLVKEYHPDTSGTEETRGRYQAVIDAMIVIEQSRQDVTSTSATTTSDKDIFNG